MATKKHKKSGYGRTAILVMLGWIILGVAIVSAIRFNQKHGFLAIESIRFEMMSDWAFEREGAMSLGQRKNPGKVYKFFDHGNAYHDMNFTCPVEWEWTRMKEEADAIWYNVLNNGGVVRERLNDKEKREEALAKKKRGELPIEVFMSLESEIYYPYITEVREAGIDYMVDYRIWQLQNDSHHIPAVYMLNPTNAATALNLREPPIMPKRDDALVVAFVSNCNAKNDRGKVMDELMKLVPFHSYGRCGNNIVEPATSENNKFLRKESIVGNYSFVFCAENSDAPGYVSEKIYAALKTGSVPIYMGAPDIDRFIPHPSSIIKVSDFNTTKDLAEYLKQVASDPKEYQKFFEWKKNAYTDDFKRVQRLAARTVQCRLAMHLEGLDFEADLQDLEVPG